MKGMSQETASLLFHNSIECAEDRIRLTREKKGDELSYSVTINSKKINECEFELIELLLKNKERIFSSSGVFIELDK